MDRLLLGGVLLAALSTVEVADRLAAETEDGSKVWEISLGRSGEA